MDHPLVQTARAQSKLPWYHSIEEMHNIGPILVSLPAYQAQPTTSPLHAVFNSIPQNANSLFRNVLQVVPAGWREFELAGYDYSAVKCPRQQQLIRQHFEVTPLHVVHKISGTRWYKFAENRYSREVA